VGLKAPMLCLDGPHGHDEEATTLTCIRLVAALYARKQTVTKTWRR